VPSSDRSFRLWRLDNVLQISNSPSQSGQVRLVTCTYVHILSLCNLHSGHDHTVVMAIA
jgi:hypothetical protein